MRRKHTVSLCMIVKNEESCLDQCLSSMQGLIDEIIIVDTGSTDATVEIAKKYGAHIHEYEWQQDFSAARNYALSFATKEWILVLDADEYLRESDRNLFIECINEKEVDSYYIKTLSFTANHKAESCVINLNHRLFRNFKGFHYEGAIHEQLRTNQRTVAKCSEIGFYHTGYLKEVVEEKQKGKRNSEILEAILKEHPDDAFHQFNLATELYQQQKYDEAIELYDKAYASCTPSTGFLPKLMIFRINALLAQRDNQEALISATNGLKVYPNFKYLMYLKGLLEEKLGMPMRAMGSYQACIKMDAPPVTLEFSKESEQMLPHLKLGNLYELAGEYQKAIEQYNAYLTLTPGEYRTVYKIINCLKKQGVSGQSLVNILTQYVPFTQANYQVLFLDILLDQQEYEWANAYFEKLESITHQQLIYLYGKTQFYLGHYEVAGEWFERYLQEGTFDNVARYYYLMFQLTQNEQFDMNHLPYSDAFKGFHQLLTTNESQPLTAEQWAIGVELLKESLNLNHEALRLKIHKVLTHQMTNLRCLNLAEIYNQASYFEESAVLLNQYINLNGPVNYPEYVRLVNQLPVLIFNQAMNQPKKSV